MWTPLADTPEEGVEPEVSQVPMIAQAEDFYVPLKPRARILMSLLTEGHTLKKAAELMGIEEGTAKHLAARPDFKAAMKQHDRFWSERILNGELGAMATYKAAQPQIATEMVKMALDTKVRHATRLAAMIEVNKHGGWAPPKPVQTESPDRILDQMTAEELETFIANGEIPNRFKPHFLRLGMSVIESRKPTVEVHEPEVHLETETLVESREVSVEEENE